MSIHYSIGTSTADSYVSVPDANTYFASRLQTDPWTNLSNATTSTAATSIKENVLKQATRELDSTFRFYGSKYNQGIEGATDYQALEFPRTNHTDVNGDLYIPDDVKYATYEQALWILERGGMKVTQDGTVIKPNFIGDVAYIYIKKYVTRQAKATGAYPWVG